MDVHAEMQRVFAMSAQQANSWLQAVARGEIVVAPNFNWSALAAGMATNAVANESAAWAVLAVQVYERLASEEQDQAKRERLLHAAMQAHAVLISRFKASDGQSHADRLATWFIERLPMSIEEATERTASWSKLPIAEIRTLREIKNRLNVLAVVESEHVLDPYPELARWLSSRSLLP